MIRLTRRPSSSIRQTGMPGFARISRISLRTTRLAPTFAAAVLFIRSWDTRGSVLAPGGLRQHDQLGIGELRHVLLLCLRDIGCHQHNPAMAKRTAGCGEGRLRRPAPDTKQCSGPRRSPAGFGPFDPLCANEHKNYESRGQEFESFRARTGRHEKTIGEKLVGRSCALCPRNPSSLVTSARARSPRPCWCAIA